jgi:hypothetical protein
MRQVAWQTTKGGSLSEKLLANEGFVGSYCYEVETYFLQKLNFSFHCAKVTNVIELESYWMACT